MIRIDRPVTFLLPFDCYGLTLSHRLLDSLGGVSRFLLRALDQGLSLSALVEVTGLSESVLLEQLAFLKSHKYMEIIEVDGESVPIVSQRGATMVHVESLLRDLELTVWLDAFTLRRHAIHLALFVDTHEVVSNVEVAGEGGGVTVRVPRRRGGRSGRYQLFDEANRLRILLDQGALKRILEHHWGKDCTLIASESDHWECELHAPAKDVAEVCLPVCFAVGDLKLYAPSHIGKGKSPTVPQVSLPILELKHEFKAVQGFPWSVAAPPEATHKMELISFQILPPSAEIVLVDADAVNYSAMNSTFGDEVPPGFPSSVLSPGLLCEVTATNVQAAFLMDEEQLSRQMQACPGVLMVSHNLLPLEDEQLA